VDELGGLARGARREVEPLDEPDFHPACSGVEGNAGPRDTSADDEDVEGVASARL
jgi:hypothetical protein